MASEDAIKSNFGYVVRELRESKKLTREKLAENLGLQPQTISAIENGVNFVSCDVLSKLSEFFEVSPAYFFIKKVRTCNENDIVNMVEIKKTLSLFDSNKLKEIHDILIVMSKY